MAEREGPPLPDDPRAWSPMRAYRGRHVFRIEDPVVEPLWSGTRVLAHVSVETPAESPVAATSGPPATVALIETLGADLAEVLPALASAIGSGVLAREAVIDGIVTGQVTLDGVGAAAIPEVRSRPAAMFVRRGIDFDVASPGRGGQGAPEDEPAEGLVAVDLLRLDGTSLLDVPLLERKRLLESVIAPGPRLRVSPHVTPPHDPWVATWKSLGLRGGILKAANSRYRPGDDCVEWRIVERLHRGR